MRPHFLAAGNAESRHAAGRRGAAGLGGGQGDGRPDPGGRPGEVSSPRAGPRRTTWPSSAWPGAEPGPGHVVSSPIEHPAVAEPVARLEAAGFAVDRPAVDAEGLADAERDGRDASATDTRLATLMLANNETGAIQPVAAAGGAGRRPGRSRSTPTPCRPSAGSRSTSTPWGSRPWRPAPQVPRPGGGRPAAGPRGGQARLPALRRRPAAGPAAGDGGRAPGRRPGRGPGALAGRGRRARRPLGRAPRPAGGGPDRRPRARTGSSATARRRPGLRLPQTLNVGFPGLDGDALLMQLDLAGVAASLGSACASGSTRPSPTLVAMRVPDDRLRSSVRFSLGRRRRPRPRSTRRSPGSSGSWGGSTQSTPKRASSAREP